MAYILIADADAESRKILAAILENNGHQVVPAADGVEAVTLYENRPFDLVFSDIFLPGKEGLETIRELRELDGNARIIGVAGGSALSSQLALNRGRELGAMDTVFKPYAPDSILRVLQEYLAAV